MLQPFEAADFVLFSSDRPLIATAAKRRRWFKTEDPRTFHDVSFCPVLDGQG